MKKLSDIAGVYFRRRRYFRLFLIFLIMAFWAYIETSEMFPPAEHGLNYHARNEIKSRYNGGPFTFAMLGDSKNSPVFTHLVQALNSKNNLGRRHYVQQEISFSFTCNDINYCREYGQGWS